MALISCPECESEISSQAAACPKCGYALKKATKEKSRSGCGTGCLVIVVVFVVLAFIGALVDSDSGSSSSSRSSRSSTADLNAAVRFTGTQFVIQNNDSFDWTNVKLEVNAKGFSSGYVLNVPRISAGQTYTVGAMQFAKSDGERFDPFSHKALTFTIWCDTQRGNGFYSGKWD